MPDHPETTASDKVATEISESKAIARMRQDLDAIEGGAALAELNSHYGSLDGRAERLRLAALTSPRHRVLLEVLGERAKQDRKWGEQNYGSVHKGATGHIASSKQARAFCDRMFAEKTGAWEDIAVEELAEAIDAKDDQERRAELVQCAAVLVAWIECIDRRAVKP